MPRRPAALMGADGGAPPPVGATRYWLDDFELRATGLTVRKTGARVDFTPSVISEFSAWMRFFLWANSTAPLGAPFTFSSTPERVRPWYLFWPVARLAGGRYVKNCADADIVVHFEDATLSPNAAPARLKQGARLMNYDCKDVSKTRVAQAFAEAFGYDLSVDPETHVGPMVEKSELNGAHDGRILLGPHAPLAGRTYQRLIDNSADGDELVEDFRTPTVGGRPICVFIKRRPIARRFANANVDVRLARVEDIFSPAEQASLADMAARLGLDWGGFDVLRDRREGRLYVVDANKTDMGPPTALPLAEKKRAAAMLAQALRDYLSRPVQ